MLFASNVERCFRKWVLDSICKACDKLDGQARRKHAKRILNEVQPSRHGGAEICKIGSQKIPGATIAPGKAALRGPAPENLPENLKEKGNGNG